MRVRALEADAGVDNGSVGIAHDTGKGPRVFGIGTLKACNTIAQGNALGNRRV